MVEHQLHLAPTGLLLYSCKVQDRFFSLQFLIISSAVSPLLTCQPCCTFSFSFHGLLTNSYCLLRFLLKKHLLCSINDSIHQSIYPSFIHSLIAFDAPRFSGVLWLIGVFPLDWFENLRIKQCCICGACKAIWGKLYFELINCTSSYSNQIWFDSKRKLRFDDAREAGATCSCWEKH